MQVNLYLRIQYKKRKGRFNENAHPEWEPNRRFPV